MIYDVTIMLTLVKNVSGDKMNDDDNKLNIPGPNINTYLISILLSNINIYLLYI